MPPVPTFFFSYAHEDASGGFLRTFFEDLEKRLAQFSGIKLEQRKLGTLDQRVIEQGDNWNEVLSRSVGTDNTLVAIITPVYVASSPDCGKELAIFLLRSLHLGIDQNGRLTGAENILLIRWLPEEAYADNTKKDGRIPTFLGLIQHTPADPGGDSERTQAIERYKRKGMEGCVGNYPAYRDLLSLIAARIRGLQDLSPISQYSLATAPDAFKYDWSKHFASAGVAPTVPSIAPTPPETIEPRPLSSMVLFYIIKDQFVLDPNRVDFADGLVAVATPSAPGANDSRLAALLGDVHAAAVTERFNAYHAVSNPVIPSLAQPLIDRLASLSAASVPAALMVDPAIWPAGRENVGAIIEQVIQSDKWNGFVLLPAFGAATRNVDELMAAMGIPRRLVWLPDLSDLRVNALRRSFIEMRGRSMQMTPHADPASAAVPSLKAVRSEKP